MKNQPMDPMKPPRLRWLRWLRLMARKEHDGTAHGVFVAHDDVFFSMKVLKHMEDDVIFIT